MVAKKEETGSSGSLNYSAKPKKSGKRNKRIEELREFASSWDVAKIYLVTGRGGVYMRDILMELISIIDKQRKEIKHLKENIDKTDTPL